jgi:hypothetical protein
MSSEVGVQVVRGRIIKNFSLGIHSRRVREFGERIGLESAVVRPAASGVPSGRTYRSTRSPVGARLILRRRGCVTRGHGGFFRWSSDVGTSVCVGNAVMPDTVVAAGAAVGRGEWHGGGQVDVVVVGGRSTSEECPSLEARDGGGGVGPRRRLRTVRSNGVPGPRDSPVSEGRAGCLSYRSNRLERLVGFAGAKRFPRWQLGPLASGSAVGKQTCCGHPWRSGSPSSLPGDCAVPVGTAPGS